MSKLTTVSSRQFNQDVNKAKRAAVNGPVFITDRGKTAHVLLTIDQYEALTNQQDNIIDLLSMPEGAGIEFDPPHMSISVSEFKNTGVEMINPWEA